MEPHLNYYNIMKNFTLFFVCLVLGTMMSSCVFDENTKDQEYYDNLRACEPESETYYLSWFTTYRGEKLSTSIPYITEHEKNSDYEVIEKGTDVTFHDVSIMNLADNYTTQENVDVVSFECRYNVNFNNFTATYYFNTEVHQTLYGTFPSYEPNFELTKCEINNLGIIEEGDKAYEYVKVDLLLKVTQGEKVFNFPKTIMVKELRPLITFDPSVDGWDDKDVNIDA